MAGMIGQMRLGASALCEKACQNHGTVETDAVLVVHTAGEGTSGDSAQVAQLLVFESLESAEAYWNSNKWIETGTHFETTNFASANGFKKRISDKLKRQTLHHIVKDWKSLCEGAAATGPDHDADPANHAEIGKTVMMTLPVKDSHGNVHINIVNGIVKKLSASNVTVEGTFRGVDFSHEMSIVRVRAAMKAMVNATVSYPAAFDTSRGRKLYSLMKKLTLSSKCHEGFIDMHDLMGLFEGWTGEKAGVSLKGLGELEDAMWIANAFIDLYAVIEQVEKVNVATVMWPVESALKLGQALKDHCTSSGGADTGSGATDGHRLVGKLQKKTKSEVFDEFMKSGYKLFTAEGRWAWLEKAESLVHLDVFEAFLLKGGSVSNEAAINVLPSNMSLGSLQSFVFQVASAQEAVGPGPGEKVTSAHAMGEISSGDGTWTDKPLILYTNTGGGSSGGSSEKSEQSRVASQLREDAQKIADKKELQDELMALIQLKERGKDRQLVAAIDECEEPALIRLIQYDGDISQALQGGFTKVAGACESLRNVLERRVEVFCLGENHPPIPTRQRTSFRSARLGKLKELRLFHLVDADDNGTSEYPLKQLNEIKISTGYSVEARCELLRHAFARLQQILQLAFPSSQAQCMLFMPLFLDALCDRIKMHIEIKIISNYYMAVIYLICGETRRFVTNESKTFDLKYDKEWLGLSKDHNERFLLASMQSLASKAAGGKGAQGAQPPPNPNKTSKSKEVGKLEAELKKLKKQLKNKGKRGVVSEADDDDDGPPKPSGGPPKKKKIEMAGEDEEMTPDAGGKFPKLLPSGHEWLKEWNEKNPKKKGKYSCWAFHNLKGGCPYGKSCRAHHE